MLLCIPIRYAHNDQAFRTNWSIHMNTTAARPLPDVETPDALFVGDLLVVVGPEEAPGIVGACFDFGATFTMTADQARQVAYAFQRAADAADRAKAERSPAAIAQREAAWSMGDGLDDGELYARYGAGWRAYRRPTA
jgi:hypothetical protein